RRVAEYQSGPAEHGHLRPPLKRGRQAPTVCRLAARLEGDFLRVQAEFKFVTDRPRAVVALGCQGGQPGDAKLDPTDANPDGRLPLLEPSDDGFVVTVEQPGEHVLVLPMKLPGA